MSNFIEQTSEDVKFVDWGELKETHEKENTIVIKENENITGMVERISPHEVFGYTYKLRVKGEELPVIILGNTSLNREMMDSKGKDFIPVKEGDEVRITFTGKYKTQYGGTGYGMKVAVNR